MSFSFSFRNNDIEEGADGIRGKVPEPDVQGPSEASLPKHHDLKSLVRSLHSRLALNSCLLGPCCDLNQFQVKKQSTCKPLLPVYV